MRATAIRHPGIVVSDMARALAFYGDLLGLKIVRTMEESGEYLDSLLGLSQARVTTVKLSAGDGGTLLELLEFQVPSASRTGPPGPTTLGPTHVAFTVDNLDEVYAALTARGIRFNAPPRLSPDGRVKVTFCRDPDGTLLELVEELTVEELLP